MTRGNNNDIVSRDLVGVHESFQEMSGYQARGGHGSVWWMLSVQLPLGSAKYNDLSVTKRKEKGGPRKAWDRGLSHPG